MTRRLSPEDQQAVQQRVVTCFQCAGMVSRPFKSSGEVFCSLRCVERFVPTPRPSHIRTHKKRDYQAELVFQLIAVWPALQNVLVREWRFDQARKWQIDVAVPSQKLAIEIEGVVYPKRGSLDYRLGGRHASISGFTKDIEKYAALAIAGWRLIRVMPKHVKNGMALRWIEQALQMETTNGRG